MFSKQLSIAVIVSVLTSAVASAGQPEGTYTEPQASKGQIAYEKNCASCHGLKLEGGVGVPLAGPTFVSNCKNEGRTADDLFYIMRTFMPYGEPGKLTKQEYVDIIAYILKVNGHRAGTKHLPADATVLGRIGLHTSQP